jgi:hypothetical protein
MFISNCISVGVMWADDDLQGEDSTKSKLAIAFAALTALTGCRNMHADPSGKFVVSALPINPIDPAQSPATSASYFLVADNGQPVVEAIDGR